MRTICTSKYDILCDAVNFKKEFFSFFSVEEPCTSTLTTPPSSLPGLPASYLKACGTGLGQGLPHPTAFLPRHPFYDPHLSGMLRHPYFTSKTSLFIFTFWYHYERNGNHLGCFMWGKEWNNVKINRKCIIPKCLRNINNCGTSPVILRYYTVYTCFRVHVMSSPYWCIYQFNGRVNEFFFINCLFHKNGCHGGASDREPSRLRAISGCPGPWNEMVRAVFNCSLKDIIMGNNYMIKANSQLI